MQTCVIPKFVHMFRIHLCNTGRLQNTLKLNSDFYTNPQRLRWIRSHRPPNPTMPEDAADELGFSICAIVHENGVRDLPTGAHNQAPECANETNVPAAIQIAAPETLLITKPDAPRVQLSQENTKATKDAPIPEPVRNASTLQNHSDLSDSERNIDSETSPSVPKGQCNSANHSSSAERAQTTGILVKANMFSVESQAKLNSGHLKPSPSEIVNTQAPPPLVEYYESDSSDSSNASSSSHASGMNDSVQNEAGAKSPDASSGKGGGREPLLKTRKRVRFSNEIKIHVIPNKETLMREEFDAFMQHMMMALGNDEEQAAEVAISKDQEMKASLKKLNEDVAREAKVDIDEEDIVFAEAEDEREDLAQIQLRERVAKLRQKLKRRRSEAPEGSDSSDSSAGDNNEQTNGYVGDQDEQLTTKFTLLGNKKRRISSKEPPSAIPISKSVNAKLPLNTLTSKRSNRNSADESLIAREGMESQADVSPVVAIQKNCDPVSSSANNSPVDLPLNSSYNSN